MRASIIIRVYNSENTVERAVENALHQKFPKEGFEVVVVNDGSRDRTREILEKYRNHPQVIIVDQKNKGASTAANTGLKKSHGEYVVFLDSDDEFEPTLLAELSSILDKDETVDFVYPDYLEEVGGAKHLVVPEHVFHNIMIGVMFRKKRLEEEGMYRDDVFFCEYDLFLRTLSKWKGYHYPKPLFTYHRRKESLSGSKEWVDKALRQLKKIHPDKQKEIDSIRKY